MNKVFSRKQKDFIKCKARAIFLEGTTFSGKTYGAGDKIILDVIASEYNEHIIVGTSQAQVEKNILGNPDVEGDLLNFYKGIVKYYPYGHGFKTSAHLVVSCLSKSGQMIEKIIYVMGANDKSSIGRLRGMNKIGISYIDELDQIEPTFAEELSVRSNERFIASLNPNDPSKPIYRLINKSRPLEKYAKDVPPEIYSELMKETPNKDWVYFFFNFYDNPIMTEEIIERKKAPLKEGSALFNALIKGLRFKAEGIVFDCLSNKNLLDEEEIIRRMGIDIKEGEKPIIFDRFTAGLDTSFSHNTPDTNALIFSGITRDGHIYILEEYVLNNRDLPEGQRIYASSLCGIIDNKLTEWCNKWGHFNTFYIDCADANMIGEFGKYRRTHGSDFQAVKCNKKTFNIKARNDKINEWLQTDFMHINKNCVNLIAEFYTYAYDSETGKPFDRSNHTIDAFNYSWTAALSNRIGQLSN